MTMDAADTPAAEVTCVPANQAPWADLEAVLGSVGSARQCWCQRYKLHPGEAFRKFPAEERADRLRVQTHSGDPESPETSGLVAYLDGELGVARARRLEASLPKGEPTDLNVNDQLGDSPLAFSAPWRAVNDVLVAAAR